MLKVIGYWALPEHWAKAPPWTPAPPAPVWPDIRRAVCFDWRALERRQLLAYLRSGHKARGFLGFSACRFECHDRRVCLGKEEWTDGEWLWPEGLAHYVWRHSVTLPDEFVDSASARGWKVPKQIDWVRQLDYSCWLDWAKRLPDQATAIDGHRLQSEPRITMAIGFRNTDNLVGERIDSFFDNVWEPLEIAGYGAEPIGQHEPRFDLYLEEVSIDSWSTVLAKVIAGFCQHGLTNHAQIFRIDPDPGNWHKDRQGLRIKYYLSNDSRKDFFEKVWVECGGQAFAGDAPFVGMAFEQRQSQLSQ